MKKVSKYINVTCKIRLNSGFGHIFLGKIRFFIFKKAAYQFWCKIIVISCDRNNLSNSDLTAGYSSQDMIISPVFPSRRNLKEG